MSATFQAIIDGAHADALRASATPSGLWAGAGRGFSQLEFRPRRRRPVLAVRQDV